jgi:hypothetical protein
MTRGALSTLLATGCEQSDGGPGKKEGSEQLRRVVVRRLM